MTLEECIFLAPRTTNFLSRQHFFDTPAAFELENICRLTDQAAADLYSWKQDNADIDFDPKTRFKHWLGSDFDCWRDVRDHDTKYFVSQPFIPQQKVLKFVSDQVWKDEKYPTEMLDNIGTLKDEIVADMELCFKNEVFGAPSKLYSKMLRVYEHGGWPCGWLGKYPEGKLIVLDPNPQ
jgi:hypothetical protein